MTEAQRELVARQIKRWSTRSEVPEYYSTEDIMEIGAAMKALVLENERLRTKADPLAEMWRELEAHQPMADANGHGDAWRTMCECRTEDAATQAWSKLCDESYAAMHGKQTVEWTIRATFAAGVAAIAIRLARQSNSSANAAIQKAEQVMDALRFAKEPEP